MESQVNKHKFIIAGGDGINPLGIVRSLGEVGISTYVIRLKDSAHYATIESSRYIAAVDYALDYEDVYRICINKYGNEIYKPVLFFTDEGNSSVFDSHYEEIKDKFIFYNCGRAGGLNSLTDKDAQCRLANSCGIRVPAFEVVNCGTLPSNVPYPVITKTINPNEGGWKRDMVICRNEHELLSAFDRISADRVLVESYIEGVNEVDYKGFSINGGEQIFFSYAKQWRYKEKSKGKLMYFSPFEDESMRSQLTDLIRAANYSGIFDIEFIQDNQGSLYFLEVNWRTGMYNYNHTKEGANLPYLWAKSEIEGSIDYECCKPLLGPYSTFDEMEIHNVLKHPSQLFDYISQIRKADFLYYYNSLDKRPFFASIKNFIRRKMHNLSKRK